MEQTPLHWSERAKMYSPSAGTSATGGPRPSGPKPKKNRQGSSARRGPRKGFLAILLILLLLAAAAAVLLLWYLPSREPGGTGAEARARSLVREAMSTIDQASAQVGTYEPQTLLPATLQAISPNIVFTPAGDTSAATSPSSKAADGGVDYAGTRTSYAVGTLSAGGTAYGVVVEKTDGVVISYYLNGRQVDTWEQSAAPSETPQTTEAPRTQTGPIAAADNVQTISTLREAMTTVQSAYVSLGTYQSSSMTSALLHSMQPSTTFVIRDSEQAATAPTASSASDSVDFYGTATGYALGTKSASGTTYGVIVSDGAGGRTTTYYVDGRMEDWNTHVIGAVNWDA